MEVAPPDPACGLRRGADAGEVSARVVGILPAAPAAVHSTFTIARGFAFRLGAVPSLFVATRRAAASAARAHVTSSSGSSNSRAGARQKERSMMRPFFS